MEIASNQLDRMATAPQAFDNQFFPDLALNLLYEDDPTKEVFDAVHALRGPAVRREWHRTLLYSPETILNRAYAINEPSIFEGIQQSPEKFAELFSSGQMAILLLNKSFRLKSKSTRREENLLDLLEDPPFDLNAKGVASWKEYLSAGHPIRYLRLSGEEDAVVTDRFPGTFKQMTFMGDDQVAGQVLRGLRGQHTDTHQGGDDKSGSGDMGVDAPEFRQFFERDVGSWIRDMQAKAAAEGKPADAYLTRGGVYKRFVLPVDVPSNATLIDPSKAYSMEMKLLADLIYNHNVPATIGRYSFIPTGLPDPRCLPASLRGRAGMRQPPQDAGRRLLSALVSARRERQIEEFVYTLQQEMIVPDWESLKIDEIRAIQGWTEWRAMIDDHRNVLDFTDANDFQRRAIRYGESLQQFQNRLQKEYEARSSTWRLMTKEALKIIVKPIILVAGKEISPASLRSLLQGGAIRLADVGIDLVVDFQSKRRTKAFARDRRLTISNTVASLTLTTEVEKDLDSMAGDNDQSPPPKEAPTKRT